MERVTFQGMNGMTNQEGFDFKTCDRGLKVKPKAGDGLLFYSLHANGTFDKVSVVIVLHAANTTIEQ